MSSLAIWIAPPYQSDEMFNPSSHLNRDDCLLSLRSIRVQCEKRGAEVHTQDIWLSQNRIPEATLFVDAAENPLKDSFAHWQGRTRPYLLLQECAVVMPQNWDTKRHRSFKNVFTWHSDLLEDPFYIRAGFSQKLSAPDIDGWKRRPRKYCLIAGNKNSAHPDELYSARLDAIRWFEQNHPEEFDLYGKDWDKYVPENRILRGITRRYPRASSLFRERRPSYRGPTASKFHCLRSYRYCICYENAQRIPGYITEKIFDCLLAGCVPIYWGAPDISNHIPPSCFIDFRNFPNLSSLYRFTESITEEEYMAYQEAMRKYLESPLAEPFSSEYFAEKISQTIFP